jgi:hypothetical protein
VADDVRPILPNFQTNKMALGVEDVLARQHCLAIFHPSKLFPVHVFAKFST